MFEVKSRSPESWGILAGCEDKMFDAIINERREPTKNHIKVYEKRQKKLKTYRVQFIKEQVSEEFLVKAESDWDVSRAAQEFFKENQMKIGFGERPKSKWDHDRDRLYDKLSYVKVRS